ncbi:DUF6427 family protein [Polaribacter sp.]|uniref:DUF6427 family protein n=1 Tax=Polaribacter sp. TaxID=1920175 RepID=UPI003F6D5A17
MLANFLSKSKPINFIVLTSVFICLFLITCFSLFFMANFTPFVLLKVAGFLALFFVIFFFFNFIVTKNGLTFDNSYAFFTFIILVCYFLEAFLSFKTLLLFLVYTLFLRKVYSLRSPKKILQKLFDSGFWLSILFILEPLTAAFALVLYAAILLYQKVIINYLIAPIIGFITPLIIYFTYCFWYDKTYLFTNLFYFDSFKEVNLFAENGFYGLTIFVLLLTVIAIFLKSPKALAVNNSFKKSWLLLVINFVIALIYCLYIPEKNGAEFLFFLFPSAVIIANGIELLQKNIYKNSLFLILLTSAFAAVIFL